MTDYQDRERQSGPIEVAAREGADGRVADELAPRYEPQPYRPAVLVPALLFVATCATTYLAGGWVFSAALMSTLLAHELGHFLQALRYGVPASLPYFIPMPSSMSLTGTLGAVIAMQPGTGNRKSLFDIAITGPIAGLIPALVFSVIGLQWSEVIALNEVGPALTLGEPLIFQWLARSVLGPLPEGQDVFLHPLAFAGWVGIFITALNLIPIGQLDGGHILYALLRKRAHVVASLLLAGAALAVILYGYWAWSLMILLLVMIGPRHPPTADDTVEMGTARTVLGWLALPFVLIGFTPTPFVFPT